jgi:hypothetical protein
MTRKSQLLATSLAFCLSGCVPVAPPDPPSTSGAAAAAELLIRERLAPSEMIPGLSLLQVKEGATKLVSLRCHNTPMHLLLPLLANRVGLAYRIDRVQPAFRVSTQLQDLPIDECLSVLFSGSGYELQQKRVGQDSIWILQDRPHHGAPSTEEHTTALLSLQHSPADPLVKGLLGVGQTSGLIVNDSTVGAAAIDAHSISLRGSKERVSGLAHVLRQADQAPPLILLRTRKFATIEELVLTYFGNPRAGLLLSGGPLTSLSLPNTTDTNIATESIEQTIGAGAAYAQVATSSDAPGSLQAILSGLVQRVKENYFADTQLTVLSGQSASIVAGRIGYVLTPTYSDGFMVNSTQQVSATTSLKVTPTALPNGDIRLQLSYSTYRLIPNDFNLIGTVRGADQTAFLQVPPGQPVIVSGNISAQLTVQYDGWKKIQNIPVLGALLRASSEDLLLEDGLLVVWAEVLSSDDPRAQLLREISLPPANPVADDSRGVTIDQLPSIL